MRFQISAFGRKAAAVVLAAGAGLAVAAAPASAKCTKLAFSVNDYGKDGPTKDAKALLDKYIAEWAVKNNVPKYTTGKKDVSCELFLNFIVFDEHTCKAEATVCWNEGGPAVTPTEAKAEPAGPKAKAAAATSDSPLTKPVKAPAAAKAAVAKPAQPKLETGAVEPAAPAPAAVPAAAPPAPPVDKAAEAAASAEKAAAAAERAAAAAERAAAAATTKAPAAPAVPAATVPAAPKVQ